jgi:uncharacterized membrane protein YsdA (DUF1294 family)
VGKLVNTAGVAATAVTATLAVDHHLRGEVDHRPGVLAQDVKAVAQGRGGAKGPAAATLKLCEKEEKRRKKEREREVKILWCKYLTVNTFGCLFFSPLFTKKIKKNATVTVVIAVVTTTAGRQGK